MFGQMMIWSDDTTVTDLPSTDGKLPRNRTISRRDYDVSIPVIAINFQIIYKLMDFREAK